MAADDALGTADGDGTALAGGVALDAAAADALPGTRSKLSKNGVFMMFSDGLNVAVGAALAWLLEGPASDGVLLPGGTHPTTTAALATIAEAAMAL